MSEPKTLHIIGGGLAGSEAAWQAAQSGVQVILYEMRSSKPDAPKTPAHKTHDLAELVCSNSFRSDDAENNAVGLLHAEMRSLSSLILAMGDQHALPAGGALAVDREHFSASVTSKLNDHPNITIKREEVKELPTPQENGTWEHVIVATGPLTSELLATSIADITGEAELAFFDAIAPIVYKDSINMDKAWMQSRYDKASHHPDSVGKDYINCPLSESEYKNFIQALLDAPKTEFKDWEKDTPYFDGCMPIEEMAARGVETPRFGPMKPVGLTNPHCDEKPYAVVQLRQDNALGTLYNIVGFQTKTKYAHQVELFRQIPGLETAEFAKLGGLHRNTFINAPKLLDPRLRLKALPNIRFAGQIAGCEGYVESAAIGLLAGRMAAAEIQGDQFELPPPETALGALLNHITGGSIADSFQPMNINFGLFPDITLQSPYVPEELKRKRKLKGRDRKQALCRRAFDKLSQWQNQTEQSKTDYSKNKAA